MPLHLESALRTPRMDACVRDVILGVRLRLLDGLDSLDGLFHDGRLSGTKGTIPSLLVDVNKGAGLGRALHQPSNNQSSVRFPTSTR